MQSHENKFYNSNNFKKEFFLTIDDNFVSVLHWQYDKQMPFLVFLHDSLGCISTWKNFPLAVAKEVHCNLLVYDRVGYGKASSFKEQKRNKLYLEKEADFLNKMLNELGIEKAILFGHSDGGSIALIMAAKYSHKVDGVITEGAHVFVEDITLSGIKNAVALYQNTKLKRLLQKYHFEKTDAVFKAWTQTWLSKEFRDWNIENFLTQITAPLLIIQGEDDEYGSIEQVNTIDRKTKSLVTRTLLVAESKHSPHKEKPNIVLPEVVSFINDILCSCNLKSCS